MPLYEYECAKCGAIFEVRQKFSDEPLTLHEGCGGAVTKQLSAPAFHLKGGGWYVTDYAKPGSKAEAKTEGASKSESEGAKTDSTKTEGAKTDGAKTEASKPAESKPTTTPTSSTTKE